MNGNWYKQIIQASPIGYACHKIICDADGTPCGYEFLEVNAAFEALSGLKSADIIGRKMTDALPGMKTSDSDWIQTYEDIAMNGGDKIFEQSAQPLNKRYKVNAYSPEKGHFITLFTDITKEWNQIAAIESTVAELLRTEKALSVSEMRYRRLFETAKDGILILDAETGKIMNVNPFLMQMLGYSEKEFIEKSIWDIGVFKDILANRDNFLELQKQEYIRYEDLPLQTADGRQIAVEFVSNVYLMDNKKVIQCNIREITERKKLESLLAMEKKVLEATLISVGDGVISCDKKGNVLIMNRMAEILTGWTQEEAKGKPIEDVFHIVDEFDKKKGDSIFSQVFKNSETVEFINHTLLIATDGVERTIEYNAAPIIEEKDNTIGVVLVFRDCSEKRLKQKEIEFISYHDQLTGLYNRRFYEEELRRLDTERNLPLTIVIGDVNGLKLINDSFGHTMGDELLKKVAEVIKKGCRADDIVARLGGDEFVVILPKTDAFEAAQIIKRIMGLFLKEKVGSIDISVSFGHETKTNVGKSIQEVFKNTEDHMYRHKLSESLSMRNKTIDLIINTLYEKNKREQIHSQRVSKLCGEIATALGMNTDCINELKTTGLLHDIGKIGIDEAILNKPQKLNNDEWKQIKKHPEIGYRILSSVNEFSEMANFVLEHHERWDGKGYPRGIEGKDILLQASILSIADSFDAMTNDRTYCKGLSEDDAINEIRRCSGSQFNPEIVKVFVEKVMPRTSTNG